MQGAFTGKYLRVDLTQGTTTVEEFPELQLPDVHGRGAPWRRPS